MYVATISTPAWGMSCASAPAGSSSVTTSKSSYAFFMIFPHSCQSIERIRALQSFRDAPNVTYSD